MRTKGDLVNKAYSRGRISGLTSSPTPEDIDLGLHRLENMAREFAKRNIDVGYFFEDSPSTSTPHNIDRDYWDAFETNLALRLLGDFGKDPMASLVAFATSGYSFLSAATAVVKQVNYPARMPIGSGNRSFGRYQRYFSQVTDTPISSDTIKMTVGDVNDFVEHYDAYLRTGETIASYTISAETGLTVSADSLTTPDISYRITATGNDDETQNALLKVTIVATTDLGRIETRVINFELTT